jgi:hypothetical protein
MTTNDVHHDDGGDGDVRDDVQNEHPTNRQRKMNLNASKNENTISINDVVSFNIQSEIVFNNNKFEVSTPKHPQKIQTTIMRKIKVFKHTTTKTGVCPVTT